MRDYVVESGWLGLRDWTADDVAAVLRIYGDPEVVRFLSAEPMRDLAEADAALERWRTRRERDGMGWWAVVEKATGSVIGAGCLQPLEGKGPEIEVGYHIRRDSWGRGVATETARLCLRHGFEILGLDRIVAVVDPKNEASLRVVRKAGMRPIGRHEHYGKSVEKFERLSGGTRA